MSKIAWSITSTKRKTRPASSAPRKRQRRNDTDGTSSSRPSKSQRTLTQAEWITTFPPSDDEGDMLYLDDGQRHTPAQKKPRQSAQRPKSTLTQMDFFSSLPRDCQDFDDTMIGVADGDDGGCAVPQLDGTYDSPRRPRKRKATPNAASLPTKQKTEPANGDSQAEYRPTKRKRKVGFADEENAEEPRRASKRLASKNEVLSDPVKNFDYFAKALTDEAEQGNHNGVDEPFKCPLEIVDTTEDEIEIAPDTLSKSRCSALPETPKKNTTVILSSQSPESLCESTQRSNRKPPVTPSRTRRLPLAERSTNVPAVAFPTRKGGKRRGASRDESNKSRVVVLKLPKRDRPQRPTLIEDPQAILWSIPSSSPELTRPATAVQAPAAPYSAAEDIEIPATSQAQGSGLASLNAGSEDNLPNLSQLFASRSGGTRTEDAADSAQKGDRGVTVRDFADAHFSATKSSTPPLDGIVRSSPPVHSETQDPKEPASESSEESCEAADFGSPIANDTQFNIQIQHRLSSPSPAEQPLEQSKARIDAVLFSTPPSIDRERDVRDGDAPCSVLQNIGALRSSESPPPIPRLVERCSADADSEAPELVDDEAGEVPFPKPLFVHPSSVHRKLTQAPLNDTLHTSSSPSLPSGRLATQGSVHPASIPHPSQMSTQDVTQGFLPPSSFPHQCRESVFEGEPDKITIKDSSSSSIPLSQIPQHAGRDESQQNRDIGPALESDSEDDVDLDLDPPSLPPRPSRPQVAFPPEHTEPVTAGKSRSGSAVKTNGSHTSKYQSPQSSSQPGEPQSETASTASHSSELSLPSSPERPPPLQRQYSPIPGFNNDTQSNFTQDGHVTAAYIHRQRESGVFPKWFVPTPYQVPGYTRRK
ncbi:hypothetical protein CLAIMM_08312 [Cladophialophora immunda]|nr:hypothetical protein CLAIMM_08312 [Cladophialophora immunda]